MHGKHPANVATPRGYLITPVQGLGRIQVRSQLRARLLWTALLPALLVSSHSTYRAPGMGGVESTSHRWAATRLL